MAAQTISMVPGYIFYDYQDIAGTPRTLCYDIEAKGWTVDAYAPTVNFHSWAIGVVNQILVGCTDGTIRTLTSSGTEASSAIVVTPSQNGGSARTLKRIGGGIPEGGGSRGDKPLFLEDALPGLKSPALRR